MQPEAQGRGLLRLLARFPLADATGFHAGQEFVCARHSLGSHTPEVMDYVESNAWDVDLYMTGVYNLSRTPAEEAKLAGRKPDRELFWDADREKMLARVRRTARPCLIFKVYRAGRKCDSPAQMRDALRLALRYAKPTDAIVLGMFPMQKGQVLENCRLFREALPDAAAT